MIIRSIAHKGLKNLYEDNDGSKLPADYLEKIRDLLSALLVMEEISEFFEIPRGNPHVMTGDRKGVHTITVYGNWRITFRYDKRENEIFDLNYEDYH